MVKISKEKLILAAIFLLVLGVRLFFAFRSPNLTGDISYFNLRQIESIRETGLPIYEDELSYSGRFYVFLPVFHYLVALVSLIIPLGITIKLVPNLLISLMVVVAYFSSKEITKDEKSSLVAALISGFLPLLFYTTVNTLSTASLVIPLTFAILLCLMKVEQGKRYSLLFILLVLVFALTDFSVIVLIFGFFVYLFLAWLEKLNPNKSDFELISFATLLIILILFILFKNVFLTYGPDIIKQNIPQQIIAQYFSRFNIFEAIYQVGFIPLILGIYVVYKYLFVEKNKNLYVLISFTLSLAILILLGLIQLNTGLVYFSVVLAILSGRAYLVFSDYIKKTKFSPQHNLFVAGFMVLFILSSVVPSIVYANRALGEAVTEKDIKALTWLRDNTPKDSIVLASVLQGHLISSIAERKNVADTNFILQKDAGQILSDINTIYAAKFQTEAIRLLEKYGVNYILLSDSEKAAFGIEDLSYVDEGDCFKLVYNDFIRIYESRCVVEDR